jgi:hypothetical protein
MVSGRCSTRARNPRSLFRLSVRTVNAMNFGTGSARRLLVLSVLTGLAGLGMSAFSWVLIRRWALLHGYRGLRADLYPAQIVPFAVAGALALILVGIGHDRLRVISWALVLMGGLPAAWITAADAGGWLGGLPAAGASLSGTAALVVASKAATAALTSKRGAGHRPPSRQGAGRER